MDRRGLALSTTSASAATAYNRAIDRYFEYRLDTLKHVKAALEADPDFVMAHCLKGYLFMLFASTAVLDKAQAAHDTCRARLEAANAREATHVEALGAWIGGDVERTLQIWDRIVVEHPLDLLAVRLQHFALFWLGRSHALCGSVARVVSAWDESLPGYGNVLGMLAFGLEECGEYAAAEAHGRRAMADNAEDLWALHAVAHVLEMQGRRREGLIWLEYPADQWDDRNPFRGHLWWHRALFALELGQYDQVLALYDRSVQSDDFQFYLDVQNAASLLLRLEFQGRDVAERWKPLAEHAEAALDDHVLYFTDLHNVMALARDGRGEAAERLLASLRRQAAQRGGEAPETVARIIEPAARALLAHAEGRHAAAVELLLPIRYRLAPMGASHAQRDIFAQLLLECAIESEQWSLARSLVGERLTWGKDGMGTWLKFAQVLDGLGDGAGASNARTRAAEIATA